MDDALLSCPICLEFFRDPVNLQCAHTYCRQCLFDISVKGVPHQEGWPRRNCNAADLQRIQQQKRRVVDCPQCRYVAVLDEKGIMGLPKNCLLDNIIQKFTQEQKQTKPSIPCDGCETLPPRNAVRSCKQCKTSYCKFCCEELHPKRGTLAKHDLIDPREDISDKPKIKPEPSSKGQEEDIFCVHCQDVVRNEDNLPVTAHKKIGHILLSVKRAVKQKRTALQSTILDVEKHERDLEKKIESKKFELETTKEEEARKLNEITHGMKKLGDLLQERGSKMTSDTKERYAGYYEQTEAELDKAREKYVQIAGLSEDARSLLTAGNLSQSDDLKNIVEVEKRIAEMQKKKILGDVFTIPFINDGMVKNFDVTSRVKEIEVEVLRVADDTQGHAGNGDGPPPAVGLLEMAVHETEVKAENGTSVHETEVNVENGTSVQETEVNAENGTSVQETEVNAENGTSVQETEVNTENGTSVQETEVNAENGTSVHETVVKTANDQAPEEQVKIAAIGRRWCEDGASVRVEWTHSTGRVFDMMLQFTVNDDRTTREISGVEEKVVIVGGLRHDTLYRVEVWVQGRPGTKSSTEVVTLPVINSDVVFNAQKACRDVISVDTDGMRLEGRGHVQDVQLQDAGSPGVPNIVGAVALRELSGAYSYWDLKIKFHLRPLGRAAHDYAFDIGIYCRHTGDGDGGVTHFKSYTCKAVKHCKNEARLEFCHQDKVQSALDLMWRDEFCFHFGFFLNLKEHTFSILDNVQNVVLYTFQKIQAGVGDPCLPVFSVAKRKNTLQEMTLGRRSQSTVPNIVYEQLL